MRSRLLMFFLVAVAATLDPTMLQAQEVIEPKLIYQREVFQYSRSGRVDPFRSLVGSMELGVRPEALTLRVVIAAPNARESVAIFTDTGDGRRIRVREGDRIGGMTVVAIHPRRVDVVIDEFGVPRRESFYVKTPETGTES